MMRGIRTCIALVCVAMAATAWADLTGRWSCDDGGTYYLRQTGQRLDWYAEADGTPPDWTTVFTGRIYGKRIRGRWADVPKGKATGSGDLELIIEKNENALRVATGSGGYRGSRWNRQGAQKPGQGPLDRLRPTDADDCIRFDPSAVSVRETGGRWRIIDGRHWLFDLGTDPAAADQALDLIRHYRMDRACAIGPWDQPFFSYLLAKGGSPWGPMEGETCTAIDQQRLTVGKHQGRWKIVSGQRALFDFGRHETEARQALAIIRQHGFTHSCRVGRPSAGLSYLRR